MLDKIKYLAPKILKKKEYVDPICDWNVYSDNRSSFCGHSLSMANVLIVTNDEHLAEQAKELLAAEGSFSVALIHKGELELSMLQEGEASLIGPFEHIMNILTTQSMQDEMEYPRLPYQWLQTETEYLISNQRKASVCTAYLYENTLEARMRAEGVCSLIEGLGVVLPNHNIVENGVMAHLDIPVKDVLCAAIYLSGKYGQILNGECMKME